MERKQGSSVADESELRYKTFVPDRSPEKGGPTAETPTYSIEDAIETMGFGWFQIKLSFIAGFSWIADSMEIMVLSIIGPVLSCEWNLSSLEESLITVVVFTGFMIGAPLFGVFADTFGRKTALLFGCCWALFYGVLSGFSPNYGWLLALRGLTGIGIGGVPQAVTYYSEFLPVRYRGKCLILIEIYWALGAMLEVVLALGILVYFGWRPWLVASAFPLLLFIPMFLPLPESPRYSLVAGRYNDAVKALEKVALDNKAALPKGKLEDTLKVKRGRTEDLFEPEYRRTTILLWIIWFVSAFCYYGIVLLCTELIRRGSTCPSSELGNEASDCDIDCQSLTRDDYVTLLWTSISEIPGLLLTAIFIDTIGRKRTMILEFAIFAVVTLLLLICQSGPMMVFTLFVGRAIIASAFQVAYVYTPEVYPTTSRAIGMGWACGCARVGAIITPFVAEILLDVSVQGCLSLYAAAGVLGVICAVLLPIETKGRVLDDLSSH